jgi:tetratricopeptide (TPR) repeat protein
MSPTKGAAPGGHLGRYEILGALGTGGMGEVYRARDPALEREVALKLLPPAVADQEHLARFSREAKTLARLSHPNIVGIYSVEEAEGLRFLTMELVEGRTLGELIPRRGIDLHRFFDLAIPLADAVASAHERGVIHRDLKPGNVMVNGEGNVKVLDFGLASHEPLRDLPLPEGEEPTASFTGEGAVLGTLPYMSPEQIQGRQVDSRSDLFSLGVILYEMLTGHRPFRGDSAPEIMSAILRDTPPPVTDCRPELPRHLVRIVRTSLEKEPRARYQAARDVANELAGLREELTTAPVPAAGEARGRRIRLLRWQLPAAVTGLLAVAAAWALLALREQPPARLPAVGAPVVAVLPLANASGDPANEHLGIGFADSLISRLAGVPSLAVVSRAATSAHAGGEERPDEVARALGATYLVGGSVQRSGRKILVNVILVEVGGSVVRNSWSLEDDVENLFALQRTLALRVSEALELTLSAHQRRRLEAAPSTDLQAYTDYSRARALLQRPDGEGNVETALELLQSAVGRDPAFALGHAALGAAYWHLYQNTFEALWAERAQAAIERAADLDPEDPQVRLSLATVYRGTGRLDEALAQLRAAVAERPESDDAWRELGAALYQQGQHSEAAAAYERAVAIRPAYWQNHYRLGTYHLRRGELEAAIAAYEHALALQPDNPDILSNLGVAWGSAGDSARALQSFERAVQLAPDATLYSNIGRIHYDAGRFEAAAAAIEQAIAMTPLNPLYHRNLGDAYRELGRAEAARDAYWRGVEAAQEKLRVNPSDATTLSILAVCEAKLGRHEMARQHAREAQQVAPEDSQVRFRAAVVHALAGRTDEALDALAMAIEQGQSVETARADDDLAVLRPLPRYRELLGSG